MSFGKVLPKMTPGILFVPEKPQFKNFRKKLAPLSDPQATYFIGNGPFTISTKGPCHTSNFDTQ